MHAETTFATNIPKAQVENNGLVHPHGSYSSKMYKNGRIKVKAIKRE